VGLTFEHDPLKLMWVGVNYKKAGFVKIKREYSLRALSVYKNH
jgi:hypothetical protein